MMKIAPIDIAHKTFNRKMMGLDPQEVMDFLRQIAEEMESLIRDRNNLREQLREKELQIIEFRERDELLKNTITTATKMSEKLQADAEREARLIISDAKQQGEMIIRDARDSLKKIFGEITELKKIRMQYENNIRAMVQSHLAMIEQGHKVMPDPEVLQNAQQATTPGASAAAGNASASGPMMNANSSMGGATGPMSGAMSLNANNSMMNAGSATNATGMGVNATSNSGDGKHLSPGHAAGTGQSNLFNRSELDAIKKNVTDAVNRSIRNLEL